MTWTKVSAIHTPRSQRRGPGVTPAIFHELTKLRHDYLETMQELCPVNKNPSAKNRGALRRSLRAGPLEHNGSVWRAQYFALDYIKFVINDTAPHIIRPKDPNGVLVFPWSGGGGVALKGRTPAISFRSKGGAPGTMRSKGRTPPAYASLKGGVVYLRFVNHPGTKANNFVKRAIEEVQLKPHRHVMIKEAVADSVLAPLGIGA